MKKVTMFYLETCPYCKKAFDYERALCKEDARFQGVSIERIEERKNKDFADKFDYFYVPCYYVDGKKVKEGALSKADVREVLEKALKE